MEVTMFDHEAERAVLGALLLDSDRAMFLLQSKQFAPEMFTLKAHQVIYSTMNTMVDKGLPIDTLTVETRLIDKKNLEKAGGAGVCASLLDAIPVITHLEHYVDIVIEKHRLRNLDECLSNMRYEVSQGVASSEVTANAMSSIMAQVEMPVGADPKELHDQSLNEFEDARLKGIVPGLPSFYKPLNEIMGAYVPTNLYMVAGRPSDGKTTFCMNELIHKAVGLNIPCAFVSMEMSHKLIRDMMAATMAGCSAYAFREGKFSDGQYNRLREAYSKLLTAPLYINDNRMTMEEITSWLSYTIQKHKAKFVVLDYIQMVRTSRKHHGMSRNEQVMEWSATMKDMTKRLNVSTILISQLSRAGLKLQDKTPPPPTVEALRDSGALEQDADGVITIFKEPNVDYQVFFEDPDWRMRIEVLKHRIGPIGTVETRFVRRRQVFETEDAHTERKLFENDKEWYRQFPEGK